MNISGLVSRFRQLRWKLTLSYTIVTVLALMVVESLLVGMVAGAVFLLFDSGVLPFFIVEEAIDEFLPALRPNLEENPPNVVEIGRWLAKYGQPSRYVSFAEESLATMMAQDLAAQWLVVGRDGILLGVQDARLPEGQQMGNPLQLAAMEGWESPLRAALSGEDSSDSLVHIDQSTNRVFVAVPVRDEEQKDLLGVLAVSFVTPATLREILLGVLQVFGASLFYLTLFAGAVGTLFGALTARGLVGRFSRLSEVSYAWSQGDFTPLIEDASPDELGQLARRLNQMADELQSLIDTRQALAAIEERNRLARDLHDSIKQQAFAIAGQLDAVKLLLKRDPVGAGIHVVEAERLVDELRQELTSLIQELRPAGLKGQGLVDALHRHVASWSRQNQITPTVTVHGKQPLSFKQEETLFRIAQESLSNVARHSRANHVDILLNYGSERVTLTIADDGRGFVSGRQGRGIGLRSMKERAGMVGGQLAVKSVSGQGTRISCTIPVEPSGEKQEETANG